MDVLAKDTKREDAWRSFMLEEPHFASLLFFVFLLFAGYKIWCVVFHRMSTPRSKVGGETLREKRRCLVKGGDKYVTTRKANHPGFLLQTFSSI